MKAAGIDYVEEVNEVTPITYTEWRGADQYYSVYFIGERKLHRVVMSVVNGAAGPCYADTFRLRNITDVRIDNYGCVIHLSTGKKIELVNSSDEGPVAFMGSVRGLHTRWDDQAD